MLSASSLVILATEYAAARGMTLAGVGKQVFNDHHFFKRLRAGRDCTTQSAARAAEWFVANWPPGVAWPDSVPVVHIDKESAS